MSGVLGVEKHLDLDALEDDKGSDLRNPGCHRETMGAKGPFDSLSSALLQESLTLVLDPALPLPQQTFLAKLLKEDPT